MGGGVRGIVLGNVQGYIYVLEFPGHHGIL